jgi:hypothetical protein
MLVHKATRQQAMASTETGASVAQRSGRRRHDRAHRQDFPVHPSIGYSPSRDCEHQIDRLAPTSRMDFVGPSASWPGNSAETLSATTHSRPVLVQRKCACQDSGSRCADCKEWPGATREFFESRLSRDVGEVDMAADPIAAESARTTGDGPDASGPHIAFASRGHRSRPAHSANNDVGAAAGDRTLIARDPAHVFRVNGGPAQTIRRQATNGGAAFPASAQTTEPGPTSVQGQPGEAEPQSGDPGKSGGKPDRSVPDCTAVMGGRLVDYWLAKLVDAQHTFMNFKLDSSNYWLVEGGPLPSDPKKTGAWVKAGDWDTRGPRQTKTYDKDKCQAVKNCMMDATARYHAAGVAYDPADGPNSNSFMEQLTFTCGDLPRSFIDLDVAWTYWDRPHQGRFHKRPI